MTVKRSRKDNDDKSYGEVQLLAMTKCLMLLPSKTSSESGYGSGSDRLFVCKTCNRKFSTFQALGGHRASHKKLKLMATDLSSSSNSKPKKIHHECSICGLVFPLGQALGGHMRRHRSPHHHHQEVEAPVVLDDDDNDESNRDKGRVVFFLDLNLTPYENDLES